MDIARRQSRHRMDGEPRNTVQRARRMRCAGVVGTAPAATPGPAARAGVAWAVARSSGDGSGHHPCA